MWDGRWVLASALAVGGCGDDPQSFVPPGSVVWRADGEVWFPVELDEGRSRRRFRLRAFGHFLHPTDAVSTEFCFGIHPAPDALLRTDAEEQKLTRCGFRVGHGLRTGVLFELERPDFEPLTAPVLITSARTAPQTFDAQGQPEPPPVWAGSSVNLDIEEIDPGPSRLQPPALTPGELPKWPFLGESCRDRFRPRPSAAKDPNLHLSSVEASGSWLELEGRGFERGMKVRFGDRTAVEMEYASATRVRARPPLMAEGEVTVSVDNEVTTSRLPHPIEVSRRAHVEQANWPNPVSVIDFAEDELFVGTASAVTVVAEGGRPQRLPLPPGEALRDLRRLRSEPGHLLAATSHGVLLSQRTGEGEWTDWQAVLAGDAFSLSEYGEGLIALGAEYGTALSWDGGFTFRALSEAPFRWRRFVLSEERPRRSLSIDDQGRLWTGRPGAGAAAWDWLPATRTTGFTALVQSPVDCGHWLASIGGELYLTTEAVASDWQPQDLRIDRFAKSRGRLFGAGGGWLWTWEGQEMRRVAQLPDGEITALTASEKADRVDAFLGRRQVVISTRE